MSDYAPELDPINRIAEDEIFARGKRNLSLLQATSDFIETTVFDTWEELRDAVAHQACESGFGIKTGQSRKYGSLALRKQSLYCVYGSRGDKKQNQYSSTQVCDCNWHAVATEGSDGLWRLDVINNTHQGHTLNLEDARSLPCNRRLFRTPEIIERVLYLATIQKLTNNDIAATIRGETNKPCSKSDVVYILKIARKERDNDYTATQLFINELRKRQGAEEAIIEVDYEIPGDIMSRPTRIFWTYKWCLEQWKTNPEVLSVDNTYKVNRFNMPLCQICGITSVNTNFSVAFCLVSGEREDSFRWVLERLFAVAKTNEISWPHVVLSDFDKAFKNALSGLCTERNIEVAQQLCRWHIMKNVVHNVKKKWSGSLEGTQLGETGGGQGSRLPNKDRLPKPVNTAINNGCLTPEEIGHAIVTEDHRADSIASRLLSKNDKATRYSDLEQQPSLSKFSRPQPPAGRTWADNADGILHAWQDFCYAKSREESQLTWRAMCLEFKDEEPILKYLRDTYLPYMHEFCEWAVDELRNFGFRATSRVESSHAALKKHLRNRLADLVGLCDAVDKMLEQQESTFNLRLTHNKTKRHGGLTDIPFFTRVQRSVSHWALNLMEKQHKLARDMANDETKKTHCTGKFTKQYGLLCCHAMLEMADLGQHLQLNHFHTHWHIRPDDPLSKEEIDSYCTPDPRVIPSRKAYKYGGTPPGPWSQIPQATTIAPGETTSTRRDPSHDEPAKKKPRVNRQPAKITLLEQTFNQQTQMFDKQTQLVSTLFEELKRTSQPQPSPLPGHSYHGTVYQTNYSTAVPTAMPPPSNQAMPWPQPQTQHPNTQPAPFHSSQPYGFANAPPQAPPPPPNQPQRTTHNPTPQSSGPQTMWDAPMGQRFGPP